MKQTHLLSATLAASAAAGILFWLLPRPASRPPADSSAERPEAHRNEGLLVECPPDLPADRQVVAAEPRCLSSEADHISGVVLDSSEDPIAGAHCQVMKGSAPVGLGSMVSRPAPLREVIASALSDANGGFRIRVSPGFWVLRVQAEGMSPWEEAFLQAGNFRWVRLAPARDLTVLARDGDGEAVAAVEVRLVKGELGDPHEALQTGLTNGAGAARLTSIPAGTWFVHVSHPDFVTEVERLPPVPSGPQTIEIRLKRGIRIVGRVSVAGGQPPPQTARVLFDTLGGLSSSHAVECSPDGHYSSRVAFSIDESLEVAAQAPGFGESRRDVTFGDASSGEYEVDFVLDSPERSAIGRVVDKDGRALEGVEVCVEPLALLPPETRLELLPGRDHPPLTDFDPKESWRAQMRPATSTDSNGCFRVGELNAGTAYKLLLVSEAHSNATLWVEKGEPGSVTDLGTVELGRAGRVWGHVRRPDGTPIEGVLLHSVTWTNIELVLPTVYQTRRPTVQRTSLEAITNQDGFFSIQPFPEGEVHLMCLGNQFGPFSVPLGGPLDIVTEDVDRHDPGRRIPIVLTVMDETRTPVPKAHAQVMRVRPESEEPRAFSFDDWASWSWDMGDDHGTVELEASEAGTYRVEVRDVEGQLADRSFVVELTRSGVRLDVVLPRALDPCPPLEGVVRTRQGEAFADAKVALIPDAGEVSCNCLNLDVRTNSSGVFSFGPFMRGNHRLVVTDPRGRLSASYYYPARPGDPIVVTME